jgi:hypothetical protein
MYACVTAHACFRWRNGCMSCPLYCGVTVAAIHAELTRMECVAKWDGLDWLVTNVSRSGREPESHNENRVEASAGYC